MFVYFFFFKIRKLFEPEKYANAAVHPVFNKYLHRDMKNLNSSLKHICVVGFEPNPNHVQTLGGKPGTRTLKSTLICSIYGPNHVHVNCR